MENSGNFLATEKVEVYETVVGLQQEATISRKNKNKKFVIFAIVKRHFKN